MPEFLSLEEIDLLAKNSEGIYPQVRLAFFCFTGLRYVDLCHLHMTEVIQIYLDGYGSDLPIETILKRDLNLISVSEFL